VALIRSDWPRSVWWKCLCVALIRSDWPRLVWWKCLCVALIRSDWPRFVWWKCLCVFVVKAKFVIFYQSMFQCCFCACVFSVFAQSDGVYAYYFTSVREKNAMIGDNSLFCSLSFVLIFIVFHHSGCAPTRVHRLQGLQRS
jgi:hypothetical protein